MIAEVTCLYGVALRHGATGDGSPKQRQRLSYIQSCCTLMSDHKELQYYNSDVRKRVKESLPSLDLGELSPAPESLRNYAKLCTGLPLTVLHLTRCRYCARSEHLCQV